jgi:hypothetical protein
MKSIRRPVLQLQSRIRNPRCQPGGHIECWIAPEIDRAHPPTPPAMPLKYEINWATHSAVSPEYEIQDARLTAILNIKSCPKLIRHVRPPNQPTMPHKYEINWANSFAFTGRNTKSKMSAWRPCPKSIGHVPQCTPLCHRNIKSIGQPVLHLQYGIRNPRCLPGGHVEYQIMPKINRALPPTHPTMAHKY